MLLTVPDPVRRRALRSGAQAWLNGLPAMVAALETEWDIQTGKVHDGGSEALVVDATLADGTPAILKLLLPHIAGKDGNEAEVLRLANGEGCALLYRHDEARGAMLMERLGPTLGDSGLSPREKLAVLFETAQLLWRHTPPAGLQTSAEKGRWLIAFIRDKWEELGRPCSEAAVERALACAERRIAEYDPARAVLCHGDIHAWNTLKAETGYKLIDPDGLLAECEYDAGVILRDPGYMFADAEWAAARYGFDAMAAWEWATVERLSSALTIRHLGLEPAGTEWLAAVETPDSTSLKELPDKMRP